MNKLIATIFLAVLATGTISGCASDRSWDDRYADHPMWGAPYGADWQMRGVPYGADLQFRIEREDGRDDVIRIEARR